MKKTFVKSSLQVLSTAVLVMFGVLFSTSAQAQALTLQPTSGQVINWYDPGQAIDIVKNEINTRHSTLSFAGVGTPAYIKAYREAVFYKAVLVELEGGVSTGQAVQTGLKRVSSNGGDSTASDGFNFAPTKAELQQLYLDAKNKLS